MQSQSISKKLILVIAAVIVSLIAGGLFWYASVKEKQAQMEYNLQGNNNQSVEVTDSTLNWKTYLSDEYRIEFKYPNDSVVVVQPSASKEYGTVFIITQSTYDDLQKNSPIFKENPSVGLIDKGEGIEVTWNRAPWIANDTKSISLESTLRKFLGDGLEKTEQGITYKLSLPSFKLATNEIENKIYKYVLQSKNTMTGEVSGHDGLIWEEQKGIIVEIKPINNREFGVDLEKAVMESASSFHAL